MPPENSDRQPLMPMWRSPSQTSPKLQDLPTETLLAIFEDFFRGSKHTVEDTRSLFILSRMSRRIRDIILPFLYRAIYISVNFTLDKLMKLARTLHERPHVAGCVRSIHREEITVYLGEPFSNNSLARTFEDIARHYGHVRDKEAEGVNASCFQIISRVLVDLCPKVESLRVTVSDDVDASELTKVRFTLPSCRVVSLPRLRCLRLDMHHVISSEYSFLFSEYSCPNEFRNIFAMVPDIEELVISNLHIRRVIDQDRTTLGWYKEGIIPDTFGKSLKPLSFNECVLEDAERSERLLRYLVSQTPMLRHFDMSLTTSYPWQSAHGPLRARKLLQHLLPVHAQLRSLDIKLAFDGRSFRHLDLLKGGDLTAFDNLKRVTLDETAFCQFRPGVRLDPPKTPCFFVLPRSVEVFACRIYGGSHAWRDLQGLLTRANAFPQLRRIDISGIGRSGNEDDQDLRDILDREVVILKNMAQGTSITIDLVATEFMSAADLEGW